MYPSHSYSQTFSAPPSSGDYYYSTESSVLRSTTMSNMDDVEHTDNHEKPSPLEFEIKTAKTAKETAMSDLNTANQDLAFDINDPTAKANKIKAQRIIDEWPFLNRHLEAKLKLEKAKKDNISETKQNEFRVAVETCKKALDDFKNKPDGEGGKDGKNDKDGKDIKKE